MKTMKRLASLLLAVIMVLGLATTAFAADSAPDAPATNTIEISIVASASGASVTGHTYNVYQIFTGTVATDGKTLSDIVIGANAAGKTVAEIQALIAGKSEAEAAAALKGIVSGDPVAVLNDANSHKANVVPGYYLIEDVSTGLPENETKSTFILEVLDDVAIKSKHTSSPKTEKKIDDTNNSLEATNEIVWDDSADHDIGDAIPFKLEMTVPSAFETFKLNNEKEGATHIPYRFVFHDTEEKGLTFEKITSVYVMNGDTKTPLALNTDYTLENPANDQAEEGHTFDVVFADLTAIASVQVGSKIIVEYTSILNENAILGNKGNVNTVFGEYRNFNEPETPVYTPEDSVIAFTYKVVINKVNEDKEPLAGATFTLEKYDAATDKWIAIEQVETESETIFEFKGLDDGKYRLTETKAPNGYNKIDPIEFTVTADHDVAWETQPRLEVLNSLTGNVPTGKITFNPVEEKYDEGKVVSQKAGLSADVINQAGVVLPETGGIGTTIFYIVGGMLAVAAVVLLITKKRMASAE